MKNRANSIALIISTLLWMIPALSGSEQSTWTGIERIVAVGDVHGDFEQFIKVLRAAKLVDDNCDWTGQKTHLVQTGDLLDRGQDTMKIMDLMIKLETQAKTAGGAVHALIGNHEAMVMKGDLRYVHPRDMESHGGKEAFTRAFQPDGKYGQWICGHNAVVKINDMLFVHGGISPQYAVKSLDEINNSIRDELRSPGNSPNSIASDDDGPLWYRGYTIPEESAFRDSLLTVLKKYEADRMVIGHTVSKEGIFIRCDGQLIMIDVGISGVYGGPAECLVIENGKFQSINPGMTKELIMENIPVGAGSRN